MSWLRLGQGWLGTFGEGGEAGSSEREEREGREGQRGAERENTGPFVLRDEPAPGPWQRGGPIRKCPAVQAIVKVARLSFPIVAGSRLPCSWCVSGVCVFLLWAAAVGKRSVLPHLSSLLCFLPPATTKIDQSPVHPSPISVSRSSALPPPPAAFRRLHRQASIRRPTTRPTNQPPPCARTSSSPPSRRSPSLPPRPRATSPSTPARSSPQFAV